MKCRGPAKGCQHHEACSLVTATRLHASARDVCSAFLLPGMAFLSLLSCICSQPAYVNRLHMSAKLALPHLWTGCRCQLSSPKSLWSCSECQHSQPALLYRQPGCICQQASYVSLAGSPNPVTRGQMSAGSLQNVLSLLRMPELRSLLSHICNQAPHVIRQWASRVCSVSIPC